MRAGARVGPSGTCTGGRLDVLSPRPRGHRQRRRAAHRGSGARAVRQPGPVRGWRRLFQSDRRRGQPLLHERRRIRPRRRADGLHGALEQARLRLGRVTFVHHDVESRAGGGAGGGRNIGVRARRRRLPVRARCGDGKHRPHYAADEDRGREQSRRIPLEQRLPAQRQDLRRSILAQRLLAGARPAGGARSGHRKRGGHLVGGREPPVGRRDLDAAGVRSRDEPALRHHRHHRQGKDYRGSALGRRVRGHRSGHDGDGRLVLADPGRQLLRGRRLRGVSHALRLNRRAPFHRRDQQERPGLRPLPRPSRRRDRLAVPDQRRRRLAGSRREQHRQRCVRQRHAVRRRRKDGRREVPGHRGGAGRVHGRREMDPVQSGWIRPRRNDGDRPGALRRPRAPGAASCTRSIRRLGRSCTNSRRRRSSASRPGRTEPSTSATAPGRCSSSFPIRSVHSRTSI